MRFRCVKKYKAVPDFGTRNADSNRLNDKPLSDEKVRKGSEALAPAIYRKFQLIALRAMAGLHSR
jgi:hypothetical protein